LETELQFPFTHLGSSFFVAFLAKHILSLSGQLSTPWVQLNFQQESIALLKSHAKRTKAALVRGNNTKRIERLQALFGLGGFRIRLPHSNGEDRGGYQGKLSKTDWDRRESGMQRLFPCAPVGPFLSFNENFKTGKGCQQIITQLPYRFCRCWRMGEFVLFGPCVMVL